jgi:hypothetical protein
MHEKQRLQLRLHRQVAIKPLYKRVQQLHGKKVKYIVDCQTLESFLKNPYQ